MNRKRKRRRFHNTRKRQSPRGSLSLSLVRMNKTQKCFKVFINSNEDELFNMDNYFDIRRYT